MTLLQKLRKNMNNRVASDQGNKAVKIYVTTKSK